MSKEFIEGIHRKLMQVNKCHTFTECSVPDKAAAKGLKVGAECLYIQLYFGRSNLNKFF